MSEVNYECLRCGSNMHESDLAYRGGEIKCVACGYRILKKTKPPVVKRVSTL